MTRMSENCSTSSEESVCVATPDTSDLESRPVELKLTAENLVDLDVPVDPQISPSGRQVVYSLQPATKAGPYGVSSLWIADIGEEHSAQQLTWGNCKDEQAQWSPDNEHIVFISDRAKPGKSSTIYILSVQALESPCHITSPENMRKISSCKWNSDGTYIAYLSADEKTPEQKASEEAKNDAIIYHSAWEYHRLRCVDVKTGDVTTLFQEDNHVNEFTWKPNSTQIAYVLHETPDLNSAAHKGVSFGIVDLDDKLPHTICSFPGAVSNLTWVGQDLYFLGGATPALRTGT